MAQSWAVQFYKSEAWRSLRRALIQERGTVCPVCHRDYMADTSKLIAHHIQELTPDTVHDASIALNPDNVELICFDCHNAAHKRFGKGVHRVYIVYGPPCSGKTTLVRQMMHRGDLIVDMDLLYQAVSGCALYDKPDQLKVNVFGLRRLLYDQIARRVGHWGDAYIVGGFPHQLERDELAVRLGAECILCYESYDTCILNAKQARGILADEWAGYIRRWFDEFDGPPPGSEEKSQKI